MVNATADAFTLATRANNRPFTPPVITDSATSRWPSTTSASYADIQTIRHVNTHPLYNVTVRVNAPAAGSTFRLKMESDATVLYESSLITVGQQDVSFTFSLPSSVAYYGEFGIILQAKSTTAGQTTSVVVARFYGSD
jgi:hypothetical protein